MIMMLLLMMMMVMMIVMTMMMMMGCLSHFTNNMDIRESPLDS